MMGTKLYRSKTNKILAGVCGGLGEYFRIDPLIIRIVWIAVATGGIGIPLYILAIFLLPSKPRNEFYESEDPFTEAVDEGRNGLALGGVLVLIGIVFLLKEVFQWFDMKVFFPLVLIIVGGGLILNQRRKY